MVMTQNISAGNEGNEATEWGVGGENVVQFCQGNQSANAVIPFSSPFGTLKTKMLHFL